MDLKKVFIKTSSLFLALSFFFLFLISTPLVSAYSYPEIRFGENINGELGDSWGGKFYQFTTEQKKSVKITYSSTQNSNFCLYNSKWAIVLKLENLKGTRKSVQLEKGNYIIGIYNNTYNNGNFQLRVDNDKTTNKPIIKPTRNISFAITDYYLTVGAKSKLSIIKNPKDIKNSEIAFSSSNDKIAKVTKNGRVRALKMGKALITAKLGDKSVVCNVYINKKTINVLKTKRKTLPKINGKRAKWTSKNKKVARIVKNSVKGVSSGYVMLTTNVDGIDYYVDVYVS